MPTAYTEIVAESDDYTFPQFAMRCARAFGVLCSMKDEPLDAPIPERFEPDDFYRKEYELAKAAYDAFVANPPSEERMSRQYDEYVAAEKERHAKVIADKRAKRARYDRMLTKVLKWKPPTPDHEQLRRFMIQQLQESIEFDCTEYSLALPDRKDYVAYNLNEEVLHEKLMLQLGKYHAELDRARKRNRWLKDLRESLTSANYD